MACTRAAPHTFAPRCSISYFPLTNCEHGDSLFETNRRARAPPCWCHCGPTSGQVSASWTPAKAKGQITRCYSSRNSCSTRETNNLWILHVECPQDFQCARCTVSCAHLDIKGGDDVVDFAGVANEVESSARKAIHHRIRVASTAVCETPNTTSVTHHALHSDLSDYAPYPYCALHSHI